MKMNNFSKDMMSLLPLLVAISTFKSVETVKQTGKTANCHN